MPEIDCKYTDDPVCPYCGYVCGDAWELDFRSNEETTVECCNDKCGKDYTVSAHFSVTYSTFKIEPAALPGKGKEGNDEKPE